MVAEPILAAHRVALLLSLLTLSSATAHPRRHLSGGHGGQSGAAPGNFETWVLAIEWQPQWSLTACPGGEHSAERVVEHTGAPDGAYARANMSLHGLWPNYEPSLHDGYSWPQYCAVPGGDDFTRCEHDGTLPFCSPSAEALAKFNATGGPWQSWALEYAWDTLARHEWAKHGSCSPWYDSSDAAAAQASQMVYWQMQEAALANISRGRGAELVHASVGSNVSHADLLAAFTADVGGARPSLQCSRSCAFDSVFLGFRAANGTLAPLVEPEHGVPLDDPATCGECESIHVPLWKGCPSPGPPGPPRPPVPPASTCTLGSRGPKCVYDPSTAGTKADPCLSKQGCKRCAGTAHEGVHYCTAEP